MSKFRFNPDSEKLYENHFTNNLIIAYPKGDGYNYRDINDIQHSVLDSVTMENEYGEMKGTGFNNALLLLKAGAKVARSGWNGKGMFLVHSDSIGFNLVDEDMHVPLDENPEVRVMPTDILEGESQAFKFCPFIAMKTANGEIVPWLASQTDMLAVDWVIVNEVQSQNYIQG